MDWTLPAAVAFLAVAAVFITWTLASRRLAESRAAVAGEVAAAKALAQDAQDRLRALQSEAAARQEQIEGLRVENATLAQDNRWLRDDVARHTQALGSTRDLLDKADQRLRDAFQSLAAQALTDNRASFFDLARTSFETYHQPIAETLKKVDVRLGEAERDRVAAYSKLAEQVAALGTTASVLSRALRTPAVRGRWGEMQLRRVVEISGMLQRCDFDEQPGLQSENGRLRPDLIVHLPGGKQIVVDAKVPLEAFLDAQECPDEEARTLKLQGHARRVRDHMDSLGSKAYWDQLGASPEMVVLFLPGETLFSAALQHDLTLIEHGLQQKVLIASPITLIALLTTVAHTWRQEALTENYREVARLGRDLYDRLAVLYEHFEDLRKRLDGAVQSYNKAAGSFESRVLVTARKMKELKVTTAAELPLLEPIETAPRVLKQIGLMGLPEDATVEGEIT
jgi:DNA recombination protein RmuC